MQQDPHLLNHCEKASRDRIRIWINCTLRETALQALKQSLLNRSSNCIQGDPNTQTVNISQQNLEDAQQLCLTTASRWSKLLSDAGYRNAGELVSAVAQEGVATLFSSEADRNSNQKSSAKNPEALRLTTNHGRLRRVTFSNQTIPEMEAVLDTIGNSQFHDGAPYYDWDQVESYCHEVHNTVLQKHKFKSERGDNLTAVDSAAEASTAVVPQRCAPREPSDLGSATWTMQSIRDSVSIHCKELDRMVDFASLTPQSTVLGALVPVGRAHHWFSQKLKPSSDPTENNECLTPKQKRRIQNLARKQRLGPHVLETSRAGSGQRTGSHVLHTSTTFTNCIDFDLCHVMWQTEDGQMLLFDSLEAQLDWETPDDGDSIARQS